MKAIIRFNTIFRLIGNHIAQLLVVFKDIYNFENNGLLIHES